MSAAIFILCLVVVLFLSHRIAVAKAKRSGSVEQVAKDLETKAEKSKQIERMETEVDKEYHEKSKSLDSSRSIRDFFRGGRRMSDKDD